MFSWMSKEEGRKGVNAVYDNVTAGLQNIYKNKLLPLEKEYNFHDFHSPKLEVRTFCQIYIPFRTCTRQFTYAQCTFTLPIM